MPLAHLRGSSRLQSKQTFWIGLSAVVCAHEIFSDTKILKKIVRTYNIIYGDVNGVTSGKFILACIWNIILYCTQ